MFDSLGDHLPDSTPQLDSAERKRIIAKRQAAISRRYAGGA